MNTNLRLSCAALAALLVATTANAMPITWTLQDVIFSDGGTASGSFAFDAASEEFFNIDITTAQDTYIATNPESSGGPDLLSFAADAVAVNGLSVLALELSTNMTDAGGTIALLPAVDVPGGTGFSFEGTCAGTPACFGIVTNRSLVSGFIVAAPQTVAEPAGALLGLVGLFALWHSRSRWGAERSTRSA
ncbi:MAG: hypothetical protein AAGA68_26040 [Pseudomonadota bacterium]